MSDDRERSGRSPEAGRRGSVGSGSSPELLERYGRKGGTARRAGQKLGFWQRVVERIAHGESSRAPEPAPRRTALELILPDGGRLLIVVRSPQDEATAGVLELEVEPAPVNDARVLAALAGVSHGGSQGQPALPEAGPPARPPVSSAAPEDEAGGELPEVVVVSAPVSSGEIPRSFARVTGPVQPLGAALPPAAPLSSPPVEEPRLPPLQSSRDTAPVIAPPELDELAPPGTPLGSLSPVDTGEIDLPSPLSLADGPREPAGSQAPAGARPGLGQGDAGARREAARGPHRGGAAHALFAQDKDLPRLPEVQRSRSATQLPAVSRQPGPAVPAALPAAGAGPAPAGALARSPRPAPPREPSVKLLEKLPPPEVLGPLSQSKIASRKGTAPIIGIDFGTTYSSAAVMRAGIEVIPGEDGELQIPSVVSFPEPGVVLVGAEARARMAGSAQWTITSPKRLLGRPYKDPQVSQLAGGLALRSFAGTDKLARFEAHGAIYSVPDICALILRELRERARRFLGVEVSKAVLTVPVGFGSLQRSALELAASQAGLEVVGLLSEPSAAIIAHGFRGQHGLLAIYDFGGGTFDFCVLEVSDTTFQVLCGGGDTWLGGDDFDHVLASYMADLFWNDTGVDLRTRTVEWQALVFACERAKRELSSKKETEVRCDDLLFTQQGRRGLRYKITRKKFVELTEELVEKSILVTSRVLSQAGVQVKEVDAVVLTGGTCFVPAVREAVSKFFGKAGVLADPNLAVAKGAALRGAEISGEAVAGTSLGGRTLREVAGRTIGAAVQGGQPEVLFERSTPLPAEVRRTFHTTEDGQTEMVVALYEESKARIDESRVIGHLRYKGLRPAPRGEGRVEFTVPLDEDGILHVSAVVEGKQYDRSIKLQ